MRGLLAAVAMLLALPGAALAEDVLYLYNWNNYISEETVARFEAHCRCRLKQDYYSDNEEMLAKLEAGAVGYDLLVPTGNAVESLIRRAALRAIDKSLLKNIGNLKPEFREFWFDPGSRYSVPYATSITLLGYNREKMQELGLPTDTWALIFEPRHLETFLRCRIGPRGQANGRRPAPRRAATPRGGWARWKSEVVTRRSPMTSTFIGIDPAWAVDRNHSGIVVLRGDERGARFVTAATAISTLTGIVEFVREHSRRSTVVAIDAPLIVTNATGSRECELEVGGRFGRFHASCHSNNLSRTPQPAGVRLVEALGPLGFQHDFDIATAGHRPGRWLFEVYPHPAMVVLFELEQIIKYKKGSVARKRSGLEELRRHLQGLTIGSRGLVGAPELHALLSQSLMDLRGDALKRRRAFPGAFRPRIPTRTT